MANVVVFAYIVIAIKEDNADNAKLKRKVGVEGKKER